MRVYFDFSSLKRYWKSDVVAAISVALVAIPLGIGTAMVAGLNPMMGIISVVVGGVVTTFFRSSHLSIDGPGNGLIILLPLAVADYGGSDNLVGILLAIFLFSGIGMTLMGLFRLGKYGDLIPSTVVYGMMAVIGIIIASLQLPILIGHTYSHPQSYKHVLDFIVRLPSAHPIPTAISFLSMLILGFHKKVKNKFVHFLPSQVWVFIIVLPFIYVLLPQLHLFQYLRKEDFVSFPSDIRVRFFIPDFTHLNTTKFWKHVFSFTFVMSVKSIITIIGVEKLDRQKRSVDVNDDLIGMGLATIVSAFLGGLPISTILACSSVNINNNAVSRWSNFYQAIIVLLIVVFFAPILNFLPNAILAAILFFAGYKFFTPKLFVDTYFKGKEQLFILIITIVSAYLIGIKIGVVIGAVATLASHIFIKKISPLQFVSNLLSVSIKVKKYGHSQIVNISNGSLNFLHVLKLKKKLKPILNSAKIDIHLEKVKLIDFTIMEYLHNLIESQGQKNLKLDIYGLGLHSTTSNHPYALHYLSDHHTQHQHQQTAREKRIQTYAFNQDWDFSENPNWTFVHLNRFFYFQNKQLEFSKNIIYGRYDDVHIPWEISDIQYSEGIVPANEIYKITAQLIFLPKKISPFVLDKEELFDKLSDFITTSDKDLKAYPRFSKKYDLQLSRKQNIPKCFTPQVFEYLENNPTYHIESLGNKLLIFQNRNKQSISEIDDMVKFSHGLLQAMGCCDLNYASQTWN